VYNGFNPSDVGAKFDFVSYWNATGKYHSSPAEWTGQAGQWKGY